MQSIVKPWGEDDPIVRRLREGKYDERVTLANWVRIIKRAPRKSIFIDVGAFSGLFSLIAARLRPDTISIAFEPSAASFSRLLWNISLNELTTKILPAHIALLDADDMLRMPHKYGIFTLCPGESTVSRDDYDHTESVRTICLDTILDSRPPDFLAAGSFSLSGRPIAAIKIDVEGAEIRVLNGAKRIIEEHKPTFICEALSGRALDELSHFFEELGYSCEEIPGERNILASSNEELRFEKIDISARLQVAEVRECASASRDSDSPGRVSLIPSDAVSGSTYNYEATQVAEGAVNLGITIHTIRSEDKEIARLIEKKTKLDGEYQFYCSHYRKIEKSEINVPKLISAIKEESGRYSIVTEFVLGAKFRPPSELSKYSELGSYFAEFSRLNCTKLPAHKLIRKITLKDIDSIAEFLTDDNDLDILTSIADRISNLNEACERLPVVFSHNDLKWDNMAAPSKDYITSPYIFDWGSAAANRLGADLHFFLERFGEDKSKDCVLALIDAYHRTTQKHCGRTAAFSQRDIAISALRFGLLERREWLKGGVSDYKLATTKRLLRSFKDVLQSQELV